MPRLGQKFCSTLLNNSIARVIFSKRPPTLHAIAPLHAHRYTQSCSQCKAHSCHFPGLRQILLSWCSSLKRESEVLETLHRRPSSSSVIPGCVKPYLKTPDTNKARSAARHEEARNIQNLLIKGNNKYFALSMQIRLETKLRVDLSKPTRKSSWLQQWKAKCLNPLLRYVSALFK